MSMKEISCRLGHEACLIAVNSAASSQYCLIWAFAMKASDASSLFQRCINSCMSREKWKTIIKTNRK